MHGQETLSTKMGVDKSAENTYPKCPKIYLSKLSAQTFRISMKKGIHSPWRITYPESFGFGLKTLVILSFIELPEPLELGLEPLDELELGLEPLDELELGLELELEPPLFLAWLTSQIEAKMTKITQILTAKRIFSWRIYLSSKIKASFVTPLVKKIVCYELVLHSRLANNHERALRCNKSVVFSRLARTVCCGVG